MAAFAFMKVTLLEYEPKSTGAVYSHGSLHESSLSAKQVPLQLLEQPQLANPVQPLQPQYERLLAIHIYLDMYCGVKSV